MKKITYCFLLLSVIVFSSCEFNKSVKVDLTTGLTSKGSGLSCEDVFLTVNDEKANRNVFVFGEGFNINFNQIEGFKRLGNEVFPGMELLILDKQGDTILYNPDLYADYPDPITKTPLLLSTMITIGNPFRSNRSYTATVHIWDKKGKGTFDTKFKFTTIPNKSIETRSNGITANEVYLYDEEIDTVIASNKIPYDNEIMLAFDNLKGFKSKNNLCELGMRMVIEDKNGEPVLSEDDLLKDQTMDATQPNKQVFGSFKLPKSVKGPVTLEVIVWDKIGTGKITTKAILDLK
ncbi:MAG: hypothetical protein QE487_15925 [Fluviicola sp.]|nr:hypothetical protein [Fluviicola sp.]